MPTPPNQSQFNRASPELLAGIQPPTQAPAQSYPKGFTFKDLQEKTKKLADSFQKVKERAEKNRLMRNMEVDCESERQRGRFKKDEIYIPYHVINDNINKEVPSYIKFVVGSRNAGIFKLRNNPAIVNMEPLERIFTSAVRYEGYEQDLFALIDSFPLHGLDFLQINYDDEKPGYFSFEHLGYENVWYPQKVQRGKFQKSPIVVVNCEVTRADLEAFPNVSQEQIELLFKSVPENDPEREYVCVQKVYYKIQGKAWVCWMSYKDSTDFLRAPQPLFLGRWKVLIDELTGMELRREKIYEDFYNIVPFPYAIVEDKCLYKTLGRASLDENTQEAVSSMVSSIVNGTHRASQVMGSPRNPTSSGVIEELDLVLEGQRIYSQPVDFWNPPYPDDSVMNIVNGLLTQNKAETSQINLAVGNRADYASRKTAKELSVAEKKETELSTNQVVVFSTAWREALTIAWLIMKAQIELGTIKPEGIDLSILQQDLVLLSAGETEVIQRQETLLNLQNLWPVVGQTPAAIPVLEDILRLMVPSSADKYIAALQQGMQQQNVAQGLAAIISAIAEQHPEVIPPESYEQLGQLIQAANGPQNNTPTVPPSSGGPQPNQQSRETVAGQS